MADLPFDASFWHWEIVVLPGALSYNPNARVEAAQWQNLFRAWGAEEPYGLDTRLFTATLLPDDPKYYPDIREAAGAPAHPRTIYIDYWGGGTSGGNIGVSCGGSCIKMMGVESSIMMHEMSHIIVNELGTPFNANRIIYGKLGQFLPDAFPEFITLAPGLTYEDYEEYSNLNRLQQALFNSVTNNGIQGYLAKGLLWSLYPQMRMTGKDQPPGWMAEYNALTTTWNRYIDTRHQTWFHPANGSPRWPHPGYGIEPVPLATASNPIPTWRWPPSGCKYGRCTTIAGLGSQPYFVNCLPTGLWDDQTAKCLTYCGCFPSKPPLNTVAMADTQSVAVPGLPLFGIGLLAAAGIYLLMRK